MTLSHESLGCTALGNIKERARFPIKLQWGSLDALHFVKLRSWESSIPKSDWDEQTGAWSLTAALPHSWEPYLFHSGGFLDKSRGEGNNRKVRLFPRGNRAAAGLGWPDRATHRLAAGNSRVRVGFHLLSSQADFLHQVDGISQRVTERGCLGKAHVSVCQTRSNFPGFLLPKTLLSLFPPGHPGTSDQQQLLLGRHHRAKV